MAVEEKFFRTFGGENALKDRAATDEGTVAADSKRELGRSRGGQTGASQPRRLFKA